MSYGYKKIRERAAQRKWKRAHRHKPDSAPWSLLRSMLYDKRQSIMIDPKAYEYPQYTAIDWSELVKANQSVTKYFHDIQKYADAHHAVYTPGLRGIVDGVPVWGKEQHD